MTTYRYEGDMEFMTAIPGRYIPVDPRYRFIPLEEMFEDREARLRGRDLLHSGD